MASIDIDAMGSLVDCMEFAARSLQADQYNLLGALRGAGVDCPAPAQLSGVADWIHGQTPGLRRRLALAQAIEAAAPARMSSVRIEESAISHSTRAQAAALGRRDARLLKNATGALNTHVINSLAKHHNDPYFAAAFAKDLSPDQLASIVASASATNGPFVMDKPVNKKWFETYQRLTRNIGGTLGTATRSTGDLAMPSDYAKQWVDTFTSEKGDKGFHAGRAMSLGYLLQSGHYSTPFLDTISSSVYTYERSKNGPVWWPKAGSHIVTDPHGNGIRQNSDVLADVLAAFGTNAQAAQHFFDVGNAKGTTTTIVGDTRMRVDERLKYLLQDRRWAHEDGSDGGRSLGIALDSATTFYRNTHYTGRISATIASQTFALLASKIGTGGDLLGFGHKWDLYSSLRPAISRMIGTYMPDMFRMLGAHNVHGDVLDGHWVVRDHPGFPPGTPWGAQLNPDLMKKLIGSLGQHTGDVDGVTAGVLATEHDLMNHALTTSMSQAANAPAMLIEGKNVPLVANAALIGANVLGWVISGAYHGARADEAAKKRRMQAMYQLGTIATMAPTFPSTMLRQYGQSLSFGARDASLFAILRSYPTKSDGRYEHLDADLKSIIQHATLNTMLANGYFHSKYYARANDDAGGSLNHHPPRHALKGSAGPDGTWVADHPAQFDFASPDYQDWVASYGPNSWLQTNVFGPYDNAFSNMNVA